MTAVAEMIKLAATISDVEDAAPAEVRLPDEFSTFKTHERLGDSEYPGWQPIHTLPAPTVPIELQR